METPAQTIPVWLSQTWSTEQLPLLVRLAMGSDVCWSPPNRGLGGLTEELTSSLDSVAPLENHSPERRP